MKLNITLKELNINDKEIKDMMSKAGKEALKDVITDTLADSVKDCKKVTGNNARSLTMEVSGIGLNQIVDPSKMEGAVYSTSGYGGYLETGTSKMAPRPYIYPSGQKHVPEFPKRLKEHLG